MFKMFVMLLCVLAYFNGSWLSSGWLPEHCYVGTKVFGRFLHVVIHVVYVFRVDSSVF